MMKSALVFLLALVVAPAANAQSCTLCADGSFPADNADKSLGADNIQNGISTCGDLAAAIGFVALDSDDCRSGRAIATFCGCPIPEDACLMCGENARVPAEAADIQLNYTATDFIVGAPEGDKMGCEAMESYLHTIKADDPVCAEVSADSAEMCQCPEDIPETEAPTTASAAVVVESALTGVAVMATMMMMM